jgi:hypothetical protein
VQVCHRVPNEEERTAVAQRAGVSAILTLRAIEQSDRFPGLWKHFVKRYTARIEMAAA